LYLPFLILQLRKASKPSLKTILDMEEERNKEKEVIIWGIFDPDEVITAYSLKQAVEDGVLVEIFKKRWGELSAG
jgi:type I site-specific restriction endonuclease